MARKPNLITTAPAVHTVGVKFTETDRYDRDPMDMKVYHYLTDLALKVGERVVVFANGKFVVVTIVTTTVGKTYGGQLKWIVSKVDLAAAAARQEAQKRRQEADRILAEAHQRLSEQARMQTLLPLLDADQRKLVEEAYGLAPAAKTIRTRAAARRGRRS